MPNEVKIHGGPNLNWYLITVAVFLFLGLQAGIIWILVNALVSIFVYLYLRYRHIPIITSLLDTDWYKLTMGQVVFHQFPEAIAVYRFFNRGKTEFPAGFAKALTKELEYLSKIKLTDAELMWLEDQDVFNPDYLEWLSAYRFNPQQVMIGDLGSNLEIMVEGPWVETILWEVPLMAIISELYFKMTGKTFDKDDFIRKTHDKADKMFNAGVKWSDFGTRRRFSAYAQDLLNSIMLSFIPNFLGTSNPYFAMKYDLTPIGTYAHEAVMAMQAKYSATESNQKWMEHWWEEYKDHPHLLTALTDTLTTDVFFRSFKGDLANKFTAVRQDSGPPIIFGMKMLEHYKNIGVNPKEKKIIFSDSLDADKACTLQARFGNEIPCFMGIGTHLTNDCGHKPLNMVIKLIAIDFGDGLKTVVKLSDDEGKHTGDNEKIEAIKKELGI